MEFVSDLRQNAISVRSLRLSLPLRKKGCLRILEELATRMPNLRSLGFLPYFEAKVSLCFSPTLKSYDDPNLE